MDPADAKSRLERVESVLHQHEAVLASTSADVRQAAASQQQAAANQQQALADLTAQVQQLSAALAQMVATASPAALPSAPPPPAIPGPVSEPRVGAPERFAGDPDSCSPFITNCSILFALQPHTFASEEARVAFAINHLTGRARLWGTSEWERRTQACSSFQAFAAELRKVFGAASRGPDSTGGLLSLRQGSRTVADYSIDFRTRARQSNWNTEAQCDAFLLGLEGYIKDELVSHDLPTTLDGVIELSTRVDRRIQARREERQRECFDQRRPHQLRPPSEATASRAASQGGEPEPMQVGRTSLTSEERQRRRQQNLCLYCGQAGHFVSRCPVKARAHQ